MGFDQNDINLLSHIVESGLCVGCGLCAGLFGEDTVTLEKNNQDYFTPVELKPLTREQRMLLSQVCPGICVKHTGDTTKNHPLWGPILHLSIAHASDSQIRYLGSSGGVISALSIYLLEAGLVDFILHIGTSLVNPLLNEIKVSRSREDVLSCAGSRYSPSAPLVTIGEMLNQAERFAFVGKPCDVAALRQLGRHDARVHEKVVVMLSFMCAGVPTLNGTTEILKQFGAEPHQVASFRYRGEGWPGFTKAVMKDGTIHQMSYEDSWGNILNRHLLLRCKICSDGTGEFADIVGADAWVGRDDGYPDFAEHDGRSLVFIRTEAGKQIFESCLKNGAVIKVSNTNLELVERMQPYQASRKKLILSRLIAMRVVGHCVPNYNITLLMRATLCAGLLKHLKSFIGMLLRELKRKSQTKISVLSPKERRE